MFHVKKGWTPHVRRGSRTLILRHLEHAPRLYRRLAMEALVSLDLEEETLSYHYAVLKGSRPYIPSHRPTPITDVAGLNSKIPCNHKNVEHLSLLLSLVSY